MKNIRLGFSSLALLAFAGGAVAPSFGAFTHEELVFKEIKTTYTYADGVVAEWLVKLEQPPAAPDGRVPPARVVYVLTLQHLQAKTNYSLANLGLQSAKYPIVVTAARNVNIGTSDQITNGTTVSGISSANPLPIRQMGLVLRDLTAPGDVELDERDVWFLTPIDANNDVVITAEPLGRLEIGHTNWYDPANPTKPIVTYQNSHDTIPASGTPAR